MILGGLRVGATPLEMAYAYTSIANNGRKPVGSGAYRVVNWIKDDRIELRDASHLWGKWVPETTDALRAETDEDAKVACIGPAGEALRALCRVFNVRQSFFELRDTSVL